MEARPQSKRGVQETAVILILIWRNRRILLAVGTLSWSTPCLGRSKPRVVLMMVLMILLSNYTISNVLSRCLNSTQLLGN